MKKKFFNKYFVFFYLNFFYKLVKLFSKKAKVGNFLKFLRQCQNLAERCLNWFRKLCNIFFKKNIQTQNNMKIIIFNVTPKKLTYFDIKCSHIYFVEKKYIFLNKVSFGITFYLKKTQ